jgi:hypothetical protein
MKHDYMLWSPQVEDDCGQLLSEGEAEGDAILVAICRVSRICLQTAELCRHMYDNPESSRHASLHIGSLKISLEEVRGKLTDQQRQHSESILDFCRFRPNLLLDRRSYHVFVRRGNIHL